MMRWIPFTVLILILIFSVFYFFLARNPSRYDPAGKSAGSIYREACSGCHGLQGEAMRFYYPSLKDLDLTRDEIREKITQGAFMMPSYPLMRDPVLSDLTDYVLQKKFLSR